MARSAQLLMLVVALAAVRSSAAAGCDGVSSLLLAPEQRWCKGLAAGAQAWADQLTASGSGCTAISSGAPGEALFVTQQPASDAACEAAAAAWMANDATLAAFRTAAHVGCGAATSASGCTVVVCRYVVPQEDKASSRRMMIEEFGEETSEETSDETSEETSDETSEETSDETLEETSDETSEETSDETSEESSEGTIPELGNNDQPGPIVTPPGGQDGDPTAGLAVDPATGFFINPFTGGLVDPAWLVGLTHDEIMYQMDPAYRRRTSRKLM